MLIQYMDKPTLQAIDDVILKCCNNDEIWHFHEHLYTTWSTKQYPEKPTRITTTYIANVVTCN